MFRFIALTAVFFVAFAAAILFLFGRPADVSDVNEPASEARQASEDESKAPSYTPEAFIKAASEGKIEVVKTCIQEGMDINHVDSLGFTPLGVAALNGHAEIATRLIDAGADIDFRGREGFTPLAMAAFNGQDEVAKRLIEKGVEIDSRDDTGKTPLIHAASGEFPRRSSC